MARQSDNSIGWSAAHTEGADSDDALHSLYVRHNNWLVGWLAKTLGCRHNALDLAQDTFVRVITRCDLSKVSEHRPWLLTIAKRLLIDKKRRYKLEQSYLAELKLSQLIGRYRAVIGTTAGGRADP